MAFVFVSKRTSNVLNGYTYMNIIVLFGDFLINIPYWYGLQVLNLNRIKVYNIELHFEMSHL